MSFTFIVLIAVVCVVVAFCVLCLKTLFDSVEKADKLEKRIKNIERNIGNINTAVTTMPGKLESSTKSIVENIKIREPEPVFKAPPVYPDQAPAAAPAPVPTAPKPEPKPEPPQEKSAPVVEQVKEKAPDVSAEDEFEALLAELREIGDFENLDRDALMEVLAEIDEAPRAEAPAPKPAPAPVAPAPAEPIEELDDIEEIDEITLDDILMQISTEEVEQAPQPKPQPKLEAKPQPKPENPLETILVVPKQEDNVPPVKYGFSVGDILPDPLTQGSALDIYFSNKKATPRRASAKPETTEEFDVGRSGKKYTVSELKKMIRD